MLGYSTRMMLCLLVCIGLLLSDNRYKVSALRNTEFFLREKAGVEAGEIAKLTSIDIHSTHNGEDQGMLRGNRRILEEANKNKVKAEKKTQAQKNQTRDLFQSSKRRVRRGSDPIHNKSEPIS